MVGVINSVILCGKRPWRRQAWRWTSTPERENSRISPHGLLSIQESMLNFFGGISERSGRENQPPCVKENCHRCGVCDGKTIALQESDRVEKKARRECLRKTCGRKDEEKDSAEIQKGRSNAVPEPFGTDTSLLPRIQKGGSSPLFFRRISPDAQDRLRHSPSG